MSGGAGAGAVGGAGAATVMGVAAAVAGAVVNSTCSGTGDMLAARSRINMPSSMESVGVNERPHAPAMFGCGVSSAGLARSPSGGPTLRLKL